MKTNLLIILFSVILYSCTKKVGSNPDTAYADKALFDSARSKNYKYYKDKDTLISGSHGPHGTFKLRFNSIAYKVLTDNGKLPLNTKFPEGSFVVKDIYKNGSIDLYAYMYKHNGSWLWGEVNSAGKFLFTTKNGASACSPCHAQTGNRDMLVSFYFY